MNTYLFPVVLALQISIGMYVSLAAVYCSDIADLSHGLLDQSFFNRYKCANCNRRASAVDHGVIKTTLLVSAISAAGSA